MKKLLITAVAVLCASTAVWSQNTNTKPPKAKPAKPAAVDCSKTTDQQITEGVKAKLAGTPSLKGETINVATSGGVVTLTGTVKGNHKGLATLQSKRVACVKKVDNQLTVEKSTTAAPKNSNSKKANKNM